jgi:hypothetical protein
MMKAPIVSCALALVFLGGGLPHYFNALEVITDMINSLTFDLPKFKKRRISIRRLDHFNIRFIGLKEAYLYVLDSINNHINSTSDTAQGSFTAFFLPRIDILPILVYWMGLPSTNYPSTSN